eukprot:TRINITY_DN1027_c0_g2_i1.p1 TRINITY_DN1027_c0_g2~~TRINITY_DN1027_c0_g2_i1.p1  ORF type:complete len:1491 (-),score=547.01 TRINITY_DN1027_c0_g2_i1:4827-9299(-)
MRRSREIHLMEESFQKSKKRTKKRRLMDDSKEGEKEEEKVKEREREKDHGTEDTTTYRSTDASIDTNVELLSSSGGIEVTENVQSARLHKHKHGRMRSGNGEEEEMSSAAKRREKMRAKLEEKREKEARRDDLIQSLQKQQLTPAELDVLQSSRYRGQKRTAKQLVQDALKRERVGLESGTRVDVSLGSLMARDWDKGTQGRSGGITMDDLARVSSVQSRIGLTMETTETPSSKVVKLSKAVRRKKRLRDGERIKGNPSEQEETGPMQQQQRIEKSETKHGDSIESIVSHDEVVRQFQSFEEIVWKESEKSWWSANCKDRVKQRLQILQKGWKSRSRAAEDGTSCVIQKSTVASSLKELYDFFKKEAEDSWWSQKSTKKILDSLDATRKQFVCESKPSRSSQSGDDEDGSLLKKKSMKEEIPVEEEEGVDGDDDEEDGDDDDDDDDDDDADADDDGLSDLETEMSATRKADTEMIQEPIIERKEEEEEEEAVKVFPKPESLDELRPTLLVAVERTAEMEASRSQLPIIGDESRIVEAVLDAPVVIICGETGCGKTTQVPQFLYEAGVTRDPGAPDTKKRMIGVTQPRRVAAIAMANRVREELNVGEKVGHQIRHDGNISSETEIKFMTDGILLKEMQDDFLLEKYSVIIIDEAHERNLNTDLLIGLLSRCVRVRWDRPSWDRLRVVVMSATLRVEDFTENPGLFPPNERIPPPVVLHVESRQYPVTVQFARKTEEYDYVKVAYRQVRKIHEEFADGAILVFLPGRADIEAMCSQLRKADENRGDDFIDMWMDDDEDEDEDEDGDKDEDEDGDEDGGEVKEKKERRRFVLFKKQEEGVLEGQTNLMEDSADADGDVEIPSELTEPRTRTRMHVLPLYSMLDPSQQMRVFEPPPEGTRLIVVATNVAETSLTIRDVRYVVDCGRVKERRFDLQSDVTSFHVEWISQASADQRAGRAGRTGPGMCFRMYTASVYGNVFQPFARPEIQRSPLEGVVLNMKSMHIHDVSRFPFPTPPPKEALRSAMRVLKSIGCIDPVDEKITELGRAVAKIPVIPRLGKFLLVAERHSVLPHAIAIASALSVRELIDYGRPRDQKKKMEELLVHKDSDLFTLLRVMGAYLFSSDKPKFCEDFCVRRKAMLEADQLRLQLGRLFKKLHSYHQHHPPSLVEAPIPPTSREETLLLQIILACWPDHVARKVSPLEAKNIAEMGGSVSKQAWPYCTFRENRPVCIHPTESFLLGSRDHGPDWVVFHDLMESSGGKLYMRGVSAIRPAWLVTIARPFCGPLHPLENPPPRYDAVLDEMMCHVEPTFGDFGDIIGERHAEWSQEWILPKTEIVFPNGALKTRHFARLLLDGSIVSQFKQWRGWLSISPSTLCSRQTVPNIRALAFVSALAERNIDNRQKLFDAWRKEPSFLLREMVECVHSTYAVQIRDAWPPQDTQLKSKPQKQSREKGRKKESFAEHGEIVAQMEHIIEAAIIGMDSDAEEEPEEWIR